MTEFKLGRRPPSNAPAIRFVAHLSATPPTAPIADVAPQLSWPMDDNDRFGVCVVAALDHALQAIESALLGSYESLSEEQIFAAYRTQNPGFDPATGADDGGMVIQTFLDYLVAQGRILGFARVDHTNPAEMDQAVWLGLAVVTGETLGHAQFNQALWDPVPGDAVAGGHATVSVGYPAADRDTCVTWGTTLDMTEAFVAESVEEAWFIVTQAHVDHPGFRSGYDLASFAAEYKTLTGRDFPSPVTPPTPAPTPAPAPPTLEQAVATWAQTAQPWLTRGHRGVNHLMALASAELLRAAGIA